MNQLIQFKDWLQAFDEAAFRGLNQIQDGWVTAVFVPLTDLHKYPLTWGLIASGLCAISLRKRPEWPRWHIWFCKLLVLCGLAVAISDLTAYRGVKIWVERPRPEQAGLEPKLRTHSHSGFSFPSNHAANNFAAATILILVVRSPLVSLFALLFASCVALSRVIVGVHYPGDILAGALIGILSGIVIYRVQKHIPHLGL